MWLININGTLFFTADDGVHGRELWKSDGTEQGTILVKDINPGQGSAFSATASPWMTDVNGTLFFAADDGAHGAELWKSDGTEEGTVLVKDILPGPFGSLPRWTAVLNGVLYFSATDANNDFELWRSDGTEEGTVLVHEINFPSLLTTVGGLIFFNANDGVHGQQLWQTDGTADGTVLVTDILSSPQGLTAFHDALFFAADDKLHGVELWMATPSAATSKAVRAALSRADDRVTLSQATTPAPPTTVLAPDTAGAALAAPQRFTEMVSRERGLVGVAGPRRTRRAAPVDSWVRRILNNPGLVDDVFQTWAEV
jgi:ELWxxDGT repeat protein